MYFGVVLGVVLAQRLSPAPRESTPRTRDSTCLTPPARKRNRSSETRRSNRKSCFYGLKKLPKWRCVPVEKKSNGICSGSANKKRRRRGKPRYWHRVKKSRTVASATCKTASSRRSKPPKAEDFAEQAAKKLEQIAGLTVEQARAG